MTEYNVDLLIERIESLEEFELECKAKIVERQEKLADVIDWKSEEWETAIRWLKYWIEEMEDTRKALNNLKNVLTVITVTTE